MSLISALLFILAHCKLKIRIRQSQRRGQAKQVHVHLEIVVQWLCKFYMQRAGSWMRYTHTYIHTSFFHIFLFVVTSLFSLVHCYMFETAHISIVFDGIAQWINKFSLNAWNFLYPVLIFQQSWIEEVVIWMQCFNNVK